MAENSYSKLQIAGEYLDAAMHMYIDQRNYFCAIHLAAAAAELLDMHLPREVNTFEIARRAQRALHQIETGKEPTDKEVTRVINGSKNAIKHMNDDQRTVMIDPIYEADWWIEHALISFEKLGLSKTPTLWRYQDCKNAEMRSTMMGIHSLESGVAPRGE